MTAPDVSLRIFEETRAAVASGDLIAPEPDCETCLGKGDGVDEAPAEGPRHADTVPVPVVVHAREREAS